MIKMKAKLFTAIVIVLLLVVLGIVIIDVIKGDTEDLVKNSILVTTTIVGILIKTDDDVFGLVTKPEEKTEISNLTDEDKDKE